MLFKIFTTILLVSLACAATIPNTGSFANIRSRAAGEQAVQILLELAPGSNSCPTNGDFASECATADHAAPFLIKAFMDYSITNLYEMAAILSLMAFETGNFKYNVHHFPGLNPGQGTRNMQSIAYNFDYASSIPELKDKVTAIGGTKNNLSPDQANKVLALVLPDAYTWASGAWFLKNVCSASVRQGLQAGGQAGWEAYLTQCVQVGSSGVAERVAGWTLAKTAFSLS